MFLLLPPVSAGARPYSRGVETQTNHRLNSDDPQQKHRVEHVEASALTKAGVPPDNLRSPLPLQISADMSEFDGRRGGVRHGWVPKCKNLPPGLERAPPRLISGGGRL